MKNITATNLKTILLVDDTPVQRITTKWFLGNFGYEVQSVGSGEDALAVFDPSIHNLVLTDNFMPGISGAELAHIIKLRSPSTPVLMYSGSPPEDVSCLDVVIKRPTPILRLKEAVDTLFSECTAGSTGR